MSIYDLDFDQFVVEMLPPDKRGNNNIALLSDIFKAVQQDHDALFKSYRDGSVAGPYSALNVYNLDEQVIFRKSVYQSTIDGNNTDPTNTDNWVLVQENFIGVIERVNYNSQVIVLTYALNKWFGTTFRQPPGQSDIYITNGELVVAGFRVGITEPVSSWISTVDSSDTIGGPGFAKDIGFVIHMPLAVYNALDPAAGNRDSIVKSFADKYVLAGVTYSISTY